MTTKVKAKMLRKCDVYIDFGRKTFIENVISQIKEQRQEHIGYIRELKEHIQTFDAYSEEKRQALPMYCLFKANIDVLNDSVVRANRVIKKLKERLNKEFGFKLVSILKNRFHIPDNFIIGYITDEDEWSTIGIVHCYDDNETFSTSFLRNSADNFDPEYVLTETIKRYYNRLENETMVDICNAQQSVIEDSRKRELDKQEPMSKEEVTMKKMFDFFLLNMFSAEFKSRVTETIRKTCLEQDVYVTEIIDNNQGFINFIRFRLSNGEFIDIRY